MKIQTLALFVCTALVGLGSETKVVSEPASTLNPRLQNQSRAEVKWAKTICREEGRYIGWPTVCRLRNGELLAVFSGDRDEHVCPYGKVQLIRSKDDGETWSEPVTIANGLLDDRDAGVVQHPDGEILVSWFTSVAYMRSKDYAAKEKLTEAELAAIRYRPCGQGAQSARKESK